MVREPRDRTFASGCLKLHFVEWGDPSSPPLLLIHGGRDHARSWDDVAQALAPRWRVTAPDLRGHGDSEWAAGGYAITDFVRDLAVLADMLGAASVPIVAHSLGGNIALRYAALFPERVSRLVVIEGLSPVTDPMTEAAGQVDQLHDWISKGIDGVLRRQPSHGDIAAAARRMQAHNPRLGDRLAHHLAVHGTRRGDDGRYRFKFDPAIFPLMPIDLGAAQKLELWGRITCPVLLVYGRESWASNPAEDGRIEAFRDARMALFDDAGHWVQHDGLQGFVAAVTSFLETPIDSQTTDM